MTPRERLADERNEAGVTWRRRALCGIGWIMAAVIVGSAGQAAARIGEHDQNQNRQAVHHGGIATAVWIEPLADQAEGSADGRDNQGRDAAASWAASRGGNPTGATGADEHAAADPAAATWAAYGHLDDRPAADGSQGAAAGALSILPLVPDEPADDVRPARSTAGENAPDGDSLAAAARERLARYDDWNIDTMMRVTYCESHYQTDVISPPDSDGLRNYGWMQLHGDPAGIDPEYALVEGHRKFVAQGYAAWGCYR